MLLPGLAAAGELVPLEVTTAEALTVQCDRDLDFGVVIIPSGFAGGRVLLPAQENAQVQPEPAGELVVQDEGVASARCTVTGLSDIESAVTVILGSDGGSFDDGQLSAVLTGHGAEELDITLVPSELGLEPDESAVEVYIGGTLTIPQFPEAGIYEGIFTFTVTE